MSTPQHILRSGAVSTPVDSFPLSLPQRSPRGNQSTVQETAAVLMADDNKHEDDVVPAAAEEKGEASKKKTSSIPLFKASRSGPDQEEEQEVCRGISNEGEKTSKLFSSRRFHAVLCTRQRVR